jgi:hypothetical protein
VTRARSGLCGLALVGLLAAAALAPLPSASGPPRARAQTGSASAASGDARADTANLPAYLQELRALAEQALADDAALTGAPASTARERNGNVVIALPELDTFVDRAALRGAIEADSVALTRPVVPRMLVRDRDAIAYLFNCCAYNEVAADSIAFIEIYDFGRSGFSNGDLMVCQPSGRSYLLAGLTPEFLEAAATWTLADQLEVSRLAGERQRMGELAAELAPPDSFEWQAPAPALPPDESERQALRAIWAGIFRAVEDQYSGDTLELHFVRGDSTTRVEIWGYEPDSLRFHYLQPADARPRTDVLTVTVVDTVVRTLASFLDLLVITENRTDTVRVPVGYGRNPPASHP